jgi:hypothetical protein
MLEMANTTVRVALAAECDRDSDDVGIDCLAAEHRFAGIMEISNNRRINREVEMSHTCDVELVLGSYSLRQDMPIAMVRSPSEQLRQLAT